MHTEGRTAWQVLADIEWMMNQIPSSSPTYSEGPKK